VTGEVDELYRTHGHLVYRRARQLLRSPADATDAVQDIFLSIVRRPAQLDGVKRITAWLYRATTHYCLNKLRDRRGQLRLLGAIRPTSSVAPRSEVFAQVRSLLDRLPEPLAEVAVYHHLDGLTYDEIAELLGCSRRQVGYYLERLHALVADESPPGLAVPEEQES
jgi:RNA polymerase sigma-70 factor (ECF subfamily)